MDAAPGPSPSDVLVAIGASAAQADHCRERPGRSRRPGSVFGGVEEPGTVQPPLDDCVVLPVLVLLVGKDESRRRLAALMD